MRLWQGIVSIILTLVALSLIGSVVYGAVFRKRLKRFFHLAQREIVVHASRLAC
jgi:hypothetical protein